ncbi:MAG: hypothetical protein R3F65_14975 [bacterium]
MRRCGWLLALALAGCITEASPPGSGRVDSESHWLSPCTADAECGALACLCGACTRPCGDDAACGGEALCLGFGGDLCAPVPACTAACVGDGDCPAALRCVDGACQPTPDCAADGDCGDGAACRDGRCVSRERCAGGVDDDGDGATDCGDPDCLADPACPAARAVFAPDARIAACAAGRALSEAPDPAIALAETIADDAAAVADLAHLRDALAAADPGAPAIAAARDAAVAALDTARAGIEAARVDDCQPPACDPAALLGAELMLLGEVMAAFDRLDPGLDVLLPYADCAFATAQVRLWRAGQRWAVLCPAHDAAAHAARVGMWRLWAHDPGLRTATRCALRAAFDACVPAALGAPPIGDEAACARSTGM